MLGSDRSFMRWAADLPQLSVQVRSKFASSAYTALTRDLNIYSLKDHKQLQYLVSEHVLQEATFSLMKSIMAFVAYWRTELIIRRLVEVISYLAETLGDMLILRNHHSATWWRSNHKVLRFATFSRSVPDYARRKPAEPNLFDGPCSQMYVHAFRFVTSKLGSSIMLWLSPI